jgi:opacity protein-like surface antigen
MRKCLLRFSTVAFFCYGGVFAWADNPVDFFPAKTVYFGVNVGGGYTTWKYLVDTIDPPGSAVKDTTPSGVEEGGPSWGVVFGFDVARNFAIELQYMQFANSHITFDPDAALAYNLNDGSTSATIISRTAAYSLSGKFFVPVGNQTRLRAFAAVGAAQVERRDVIADRSCVTPYLGAGADYHFTRHWIVESGFQYYTGFGVSELQPVSDFVPFAWDAYARLAYQL